MKKILEIALGIATSVGGFLEIGSLATAVQAGSEFRFQLIWAIALGAMCLIFLVEMSGRFSAISKHTIPGEIRERFGFNFFFIHLVVLSIVILLVLAAEMGGVCIALEFATGMRFQWWALQVALMIWLLLWKGTFGLVEKGVSLLGLVTVCFVVGAVKYHPSYQAIGAGLIPSLPHHDTARYWFIAVSILGASITPYLMYFYSSGAVEDQWDEGYLGINRIVSTLGMSFGALMAVGTLVVAAFYFSPSNTQVNHYSQLAPMLTGVFPRWGLILFIASLGIACLGAALEVSLEIGYLFAQGLGWNWSENQPPHTEARFSLTYSISILLASLIVLIGIDPLKVTVFSMALTAATLPFATLPFLMLMNDPNYVGEHVNGHISNTVVVIIIGLGFVLAIVTIPLEIVGG